MDEITMEIEKKIPLGIVGFIPGTVAIVKKGAQNYAIIDLQKKTVRKAKTPYNMVNKAMQAMKRDGIVISQQDKKEILDLANSQE